MRTHYFVRLLTNKYSMYIYSYIKHIITLLINTILQCTSLVVRSLFRRLLARPFFVCFAFSPKINVK